MQNFLGKSIDKPQTICYNIFVRLRDNQEKRKEVNKMYTLTVEHKYCGCTRVIQGNSIAEAFANTNTDMNVWIVKNIEKN